MDVVAPLNTGALTVPIRRGDSRNVEAVAKGLESLFFSLLCKQMRETLEPGTLFGSDHGDVLGGLFDQFMGDHLAQSQSLGIAAMVRKQLAAKEPHEQHPPKSAHPGAAPRTAGAPLS